jgi:phage tail-like protein
MAEAASAQRERYPLAAYNFRVKVGETSMSFTEVSGIAVESDHVVYNHGLSFWEGETIETVARDRFAPITCKRGTVLGVSPLFLYQWLRARDLRSMEVTLCDASGKAALAWKIRAAVPTKLTAPTFDAAANQLSVDTLEILVKGVSLAEP